ncbi:MAG: hypothetical protein JW864_17985 [Spirochaetes bacterium]|nr:hypothetical protein [Spirochaetota bacterium]
MKNRNLHIEITRRNEPSNDLEYWQSKTPEERFAAAEELRRHFYVMQGYTEIPRIKKVITIRKRNADTF